MKLPVKIALIALAVLVLAGGAVFGYVHSKLVKIQYDDGTLHFDSEDERVAFEKDVRDRIVEGNDPDVQEQDADMKEATQDLTPVVQRPNLPDMEILHDDNILNILLIGTDERTGVFSAFARSDSMMILSLNKSTGAAKLVSLERGMGVPILDGEYKNQWDWLTNTFCYGGADLLMREVRECFRVDVDRYIRVNFKTFIQGINAIGGIDIELTEAEANYINLMLETDYYTPGLNRLPGTGALAYARTRHIDSDWTRIRRQRNVIQAAINKTRSLSAGKLNYLLNQVLPLVRTNFTQSEIVSLITLAPRFQGVAFQQMTIPASGTYGGMRGMGGRSLYAVDFARNAQILRDFLYS